MPPGAMLSQNWYSAHFFPIDCDSGVKRSAHYLWFMKHCCNIYCIFILLRRVWVHLPKTLLANNAQAASIQPCCTRCRKALIAACLLDPLWDIDSRSRPTLQQCRNHIQRLRSMLKVAAAFIGAARELGPTPAESRDTWDVK
jgi:hypothetical protein